MNSGGLIEGAGMFELMRGDQMHVICDFLARYVRKLHSDLYIKNILTKKAGLTFLDLIGPSDVSYVISLIENSKEVWSQAVSNGTNVDDTAGGEGGEKKAKPKFTTGEGKKRVFGETVWNKSGRLFFQRGVENWRKAFDSTTEEYKILREAWEKWVDERANQMVLGKWSRKTMKSVLATRKKKVQAGVSPQQGERGEGGDEDDEEVVKKVRYDSDVEFDQPYYDGDEDAGDEDGEVGAMDEEDGGSVDSNLVGEGEGYNGNDNDESSQSSGNEDDEEVNNLNQAFMEEEATSTGRATTTATARGMTMTMGRVATTTMTGRVAATMTGRAATTSTGRVVAMTAAATGERPAKQTRARAPMTTGTAAARSQGGHVNQKKRKATEPTIESPRTLTMRTRNEGVRKK